jgi:purine-binding chemotaxis protein CheW
VKVNPIHVDEPSLPTAARRAAPSWCLFRCGHAPFAVRLESVAEVVEIERLVRLPQGPPRVLGLCALRREVIPVVTLEEATHAPAPTAKTTVLILRTSRGTWGVRIDGLGTVVADGTLEPEGRVEDGSGGTFLGTVRRDGLAHAVIDPEATWRDLRQAADDWYCSPPGHVSTLTPAHSG